MSQQRVQLPSGRILAGGVGESKGSFQGEKYFFKQKRKKIISLLPVLQDIKIQKGKLIMTEHKNIQDPKKYSKKDYEKFEYQLFADDTPTEMLKDIVMTLAHLPTKRAQDLLAKFNESDIAEEVEWLEPAMDEGKSLYIWPENDQEERDMMALKLYHKNNDQITELMDEVDVSECKIKQYEIELAALEKLQKEKLSKDEKEDIKYRIIAIKDIIKMEENHLDETEKDIAVQEKINEKIKEGIKTERYKNLETWDISGFHFDREG